MDILKDIKEDLGKGEDKYLYIGVVHAVQQAGQITQKLQLRHNKNQNAVKDRLKHIKDTIKLQRIQTVQITKPLQVNIAAST